MSRRWRPRPAAMTVSAIAIIPFAVAAGFPVPDPATALWFIVLAVAATGGASCCSMR